jgi:hypothetical protein
MMMFHCLFQFGAMGICPPMGMQPLISMITTVTMTTMMRMMILTRKWRQYVYGFQPIYKNCHLMFGIFLSQFLSFLRCFSVAFPIGRFMFINVKGKVVPVLN